MKPIVKKQLLCTMDEEIWTSVTGYERYEVSNYGNIRRWCPSKNRYRYLKPRATGIELHREIGGVEETRVIGLPQLVATEFCKRFSASRDCVIHIDGNAQNNRADNLLWVDIEDANICNKWRHIEVGDERFQISSRGKVRSISIGNDGRIVAKEIAGHETPDGHMAVTIRKDGKAVKWLIHYLVAMAFLPNPENKSQVHHKDNNGLNNCVANLQWVTPLERRALLEKVATQNKKDIRELLLGLKSPKP